VGVAIDFAMRESVCPFHGGTAGVRTDDELVFPLSKSAVVQFLPGASELTLFHGDKEISFETPGQIAFATGLAKQSRFRAGEAVGWTDLPWSEIAEMLEGLIGASVLVRAEDFDGAAAIEREDHPSPLPPAVAERAHSWREPDLMRALTGHDLEPGYIEAVVPIFRIVHPCLDRDGRQVGEGNVFPKVLRLDVATQWRTCTYSGTRYQPHRPMNVAALRAMRAHWREMMVVLREMRSAYLRRLPEAARGWTLGHVERLATMVLALPAYLVMREEGAIATGALHPVLSNVFRVTDGLRMAVHQMMFVPIAEAMLDPETPTSPAEIFAYAERNYSFHSEHGVCAGPQFMIEDFLAVLIDGAEPKGGGPKAIDPDVKAALEAIEPAIDYGLLGLKSHAAAFSLWPAMARAFEQMAEALGAKGPIGEAFETHRQRMKSHSYLGAEASRRHREAVYAEMWSSSSSAVRGVRPRPAFLAEREAIHDRAGTASLIHAIIEDQIAGQAAMAVADAIAAFATRGQAVVRAVEAAQAEINRLLGRPAPQRPLTLRDLDLHNKLITGQPRSLPFLPDELERLFGLAIDADAASIRVARSSAHEFDGESPIEALRASRAQTHGD
jgi:hypothetical protein